MSKKFDLNSLITEEDIRLVKEAAKESRERRERIEYERRNNPNFEEWYAAECKKIREEYEKYTTDKSFAELKREYEREIELKHSKGL